jgi:hypothetical protein
VLVVGAFGCALAEAIGSALGARAVGDFEDPQCAAADQMVVVSATRSGARLEDMSVSDFQRLMSGELDGPWHSIRAALGAAAAAPRAVVHVIEADPSAVHLRFAAELLLRSAAREGGERRPPVRLNALLVTPDVPFDEVVATTSFLLSSDSRFMTGDTLRLGFSA